MPKSYFDWLFGINKRLLFGYLKRYTIGEINFRFLKK